MNRYRRNAIFRARAPARGATPRPSLTLGLGFIELPVVGDVPGAAELAAGSPVVEPRPLGTPLCAFAQVAPTSSATANEADAKDIVVSFMAIPFGCP